MEVHVLQMSKSSAFAHVPELGLHCFASSPDAALWGAVSKVKTIQHRQKQQPAPRTVLVRGLGPFSRVEQLENTSDFRSRTALSDWGFTFEFSDLPPEVPASMPSEVSCDLRHTRAQKERAANKILNPVRETAASTGRLIMWTDGSHPWGHKDPGWAVTADGKLLFAGQTPGFSYEAELKAIEVALAWCAHNGVEATVVSDCRAAVAKLQGVASRQGSDLVCIPGHVVPENIQVDEFARQAASGALVR